jgi:hypothetical protein
MPFLNGGEKKQVRGVDVGELGKSQKDVRLKGWKRNGTVFFLCLLTAFLFADQNISMVARDGLIPQQTLNPQPSTITSTINHQPSTINPSTLQPFNPSTINNFPHSGAATKS